MLPPCGYACNLYVNSGMLMDQDETEEIVQPSRTMPEGFDEVEAAMAALLNPVYNSLRKYGKTEFEIEISIKAEGSVTKRPVGYEKVKEEWKTKNELWRNDAAFSKHRGAL